MFSSNATQVSSAANYIEDVFSTYLYTGTNANQTITNNIDLSTKGGLVWNKVRGATGNNSYHYWVDTARGRAFGIGSNASDAQYTSSAGTDLTAFTSTGYTLGPQGNFAASNGNGASIVSWTFRKQPKFFDIVTYTGTGSNTTIAHSLGSVPGCIIVKRTDTTANWSVYHQSLNEYRYISLNLTTGETISSAFWNNTAPTSTNFTVGTDATVNASGGTYVAYLFASDAGGFGLTGTDNVITCGQYNCNGLGNATVTLGYEPQLFLHKRRDSTGNWIIVDNMRGFTTGGTNAQLYPNLSSAESSSTYPERITATGVDIVGDVASSTNIYIAIRRGPMKVPTDATKVFAPVVSSVSSGTQITAGFPVDMQIFKYRAGTVNNFVVDRLRGVGTTTTATSTPQIITNTTDAEVNTGGIARNWDNTSFAMPSGFGGISDIFWNFGRAPSFFDEVCYTGTGSATTINHNLGVVPEMIIVKNRSNAASWPIYSKSLTVNQYLILDSTAAAATFNLWNATAPTSTVFSVSTNSYVNASANTYVAYLFATCAGVSKVGSYSGTGSNQTIDCGFTGGARFVLIKRTDATSNWSVFDTARGMVSGTDPVLSLNTTSAESNLNSVYTITTGFQVLAYVNSSYPDVNISGGSYIFLAIA